MTYTSRTFVESLEIYPVGVFGLPEHIEPSDAAERFKKMEIPLHGSFDNKNPKSLFWGFFPKFLYNEKEELVFEMRSYCYKPDSEGYQLTIHEAGIKYLEL